MAKITHTRSVLIDEKFDDMYKQLTGTYQAISIGNNVGSMAHATEANCLYLRRVAHVVSSSLMPNNARFWVNYKTPYKRALFSIRLTGTFP